MANLDQIQFAEEFSQLPKPLQEILSSSSLGKTISYTLSVANISQEKYNDLMEITSEVLMLHLPVNAFQKNLISKYQFNENQAKIIDQIIQKQVFQPLLPFLKQEKISFSSPPSKKSPTFLKEKFQQISTLPKKIQFPDFSKVLTFKNKASEKMSPSKIPPKTPLNELKEKEAKEEREKEIITKIEKKESKEIFREIPPAFSVSIPPAPETKSEEKVEKQNIKKPQLPEIKIPEPVEIKIEEPVHKNIEPPPITLPQTPPEKQEKIKETLLKAMTTKKTEVPKIVEEMEKVEKTPPIIKQQPDKIKKEKATAQLQEASEIVTGQDKNFAKQTEKFPLPPSKSSILGVKIKEFEKKEQRLPKSSEPIAYQKHIKKEEKPFGET